MTAALIQPASRHRPTPGTLWVALATVYLVWGSTYLAIRVVVHTMPGLLSAAVRFLVAAAVLGAFLRLRRGAGALRVSRRQLGAATLIGVLLLLGGNGLVVLGEETVPSGLAALLVAAVPLWVVVLRRAFGDRPGWATVLGILIGFAGLLVLIVPGSSTSGASAGGVLIILVATTSWASGSFFSGRLEMPADPFVATFWEMLAGGLACLLGGLVLGEAGQVDLGSFSGESWIALLYLIAFGSLAAFTAYVWLLHHAPISLVATYAYVNPVVAVILGALILGEAVTLPILVGGAIVVAGVGVVVSTEGRRRAVTQPIRRPAAEEDLEPAA
jgi:drug/metabolite transporter (DMT)-like permease